MTKPKNTGTRRARARDADKPADNTPAVADTRTRGQVLLSAVKGTVREVADKAGVGRSAISDWRTGKKVPGDDARAQLEQTLGIPRHAWDEREGAGPAKPPKAEPKSRGSQALGGDVLRGRVARAQPRADVLADLEVGDELPPTLAMVDEQITLLRDRQQDHENPLTASEAIRLVDALGKLMTQRARLEEAAINLEERLVAHPTWVRLKKLLRQILTPYPEAMAQLEEALTAWGGEG